MKKLCLLIIMCVCERKFWAICIEKQLVDTFFFYSSCPKVLLPPLGQNMPLHPVITALATVLQIEGR